MPWYDYHCPANGRTVAVRHPIGTRLRIWGELCYAAQIPMGDTDPVAPVEKLISAPAVLVPVSDRTLKEKGFTKLVRRDRGVYENVTAGDEEARYMKAGDASSLPRLNRKVGD